MINKSSYSDAESLLASEPLTDLSTGKFPMRLMFLVIRWSSVEDITGEILHLEEWYSGAEWLSNTSSFT